MRTIGDRLGTFFNSIKDEEAEIDFVELSIESARVELEADMARERARERIQMEMYDDPYLNWSGHR